MIKKGNRGTNVMNGSLIETLIVQSEDLVQVVAKARSFDLFFILFYFHFWKF